MPPTRTTKSRAAALKRAKAGNKTSKEIVEQDNSTLNSMPELTAPEKTTEQKDQGMHQLKTSKTTIRNI